MGSLDRTIRATHRAGKRRLSPTDALLYATYLGGSAADAAYAIAVDPQGNAYLTATTASSRWVRYHHLDRDVDLHPPQNLGCRQYTGRLLLDGEIMTKSRGGQEAVGV